MKNTHDVIGGGILCALGIAAGIQSIALRIGSPTEPQPGFFPFVGSMLLLFFSVIIIVQGCLGAEQERRPHGNVWRPLPLVVALAILAPTMDLLGYVASTFIPAALILRIMGVRSWRVTVITGLCLSVGTYLLFDKLLGVELPVGYLSRIGR
jgi:hypothetical protein